MAKTPIAGMSCETETKSLANSNGVSKAKTPKENSFDGTTQTGDYTVDDKYIERRLEKRTKLLSRFDEFVMNDGRRRAPKTQATIASTSVPLVRLRH